MKNFPKKLATALAMALTVFGAQAQTVTDTSVTITGSFIAACSITGNNLTLGSADLPSYIDSTFPAHTHTRFPVNLAVTCNSPSIPWRMYNINEAGVPLSIGATADNTACIADAAQPGEGYHKCAGNTSTVYHGGAFITGTGNEVKPTLLLIWYAQNGIYYPYKGSGAINAVIPMRMEY